MSPRDNLQISLERSMKIEQDAYCCSPDIDTSSQAKTGLENSKRKFSYTTGLISPDGTGQNLVNTR